MAYAGKSTHIEIRFDRPSGLWHWRMLSVDGHLLNRSRDFELRTECEAEALEEELPIVGLSRRWRG